MLMVHSIKSTRTKKDCQNFIFNRDMAFLFRESNSPLLDIFVHLYRNNQSPSSHPPPSLYSTIITSSYRHIIKDNIELCRAPLPRQCCPVAEYSITAAYMTIIHHEQHAHQDIVSLIMTVHLVPRGHTPIDQRRIAILHAPQVPNKITRARQIVKHALQVSFSICRRQLC